MRRSLNHCIVTLALAVFTMIGVSSAHAQAGSKIGYVDVEKVTQKAKFVSGMLKDIESSMDQKQKALQAKEDEFNKLRSEIERKSTVTSEGETDAMRKKARELGGQIQDGKDELNKALEKARKEQMEPALDRILETVKAIGKEENFDVILRGDTIIYGSTGADITQKVIDRLDSEGPVSSKPTSGDNVDAERRAAATQEVTATPEKTATPKPKATKTRKYRRRAATPAE